MKPRNGTIKKEPRRPEASLLEASRPHGVSKTFGSFHITNIFQGLESLHALCSQLKPAQVFAVAAMRC